MPKFSHRWVGDETGPFDDAAVLHPEGAERALVYTLDVITPIVDDPRVFGRIAAANSLSDVYAMGGRPEVALSFAGIPGELGTDVLASVLGGMSEKAIEAGCAIVGGHTIKDTEPKCGLAVIGSVSRDELWTHRGAKAGQAIVLTKPLGTGVLAQAMKKGAADEASIQIAVENMQTLNAAARDAGHAAKATAATDVTGFGMLGHLMHIVQASGVSAVIDSAQVPLLPGALEAARAGHVPGGSKKNAEYAAPALLDADTIDADLLQVLADAQTSGGLLLTVPLDAAEGLVASLAGAAIIGRIEAGDAGKIRLS